MHSSFKRRMTLVNKQDEYDEQIRQFLFGHELKWYYENPCISKEDMMHYMELEMNAEQMEKILKRAKGKIDHHVSRYSCGGDGGGDSSQNNLNAKFPELRCVLLGKSGSGKSSVGNLLLGVDIFEIGEDESAGTTTIQYDSACIDGCNLRIIDTPGLEHGKGVDVGLELSKIFQTFKDGVHIFILTINLGNPRTTASDIKVFKDLKEKFGEGLLEHMVIIFTNAASHFKEGSDDTLQTYIDNSERIAELCKYTRWNFIAVENNAVTYEQKLFRQKVLNLMRKSVSAAPSDYYTADLFEEIKQNSENALNERRKQRKEQKMELEREIKHHVQETVSVSLFEQISIVSEKMDETVQTILPHITKRVDWMDELEHKEHCTDKICEMLEERVRANVLDHVEDIVQNKVNDHSTSASEYLEVLKMENTREVQMVGEDRINSLINKRLIELKESITTRAATIRILGRMRTFVIENIKHHNEIDDLYILWSEQAGTSEFTEVEQRQMLQECLQHPKIREGIESHTEEKKNEALSRVSVLATERVLKFICDKTRSEMNKIRGSKSRMKTEVNKFTTEVIDEIDTKPLKKHDVRQEIHNILEVTLENIVKASFIEKVKMFFSPILGVNHVEGLMSKYVPDRQEDGRQEDVKSGSNNCQQ